MTATPYALAAVDRVTYRRYSIGLTRAVEVDNPELFAALIAQTADTIAREWVRRYSVPFPVDRIDWRVNADDADPNGDENLRRLAAAKAVHE